MKVVLSRMLCVSALVLAVAAVNGQTPQSPVRRIRGLA